MEHSRALVVCIPEPPTPCHQEAGGRGPRRALCRAVTTVVHRWTQMWQQAWGPFITNDENWDCSVFVGHF